jgi:hypothetical protein
VHPAEEVLLPVAPPAVVLPERLKSVEARVASLLQKASAAESAAGSRVEGVLDQAGDRLLRLEEEMSVQLSAAASKWEQEVATLR